MVLTDVLAADEIGVGSMFKLIVVVWRYPRE
jgi:hypothetical protein